MRAELLSVLAIGAIAGWGCGDEPEAGRTSSDSQPRPTTIDLPHVAGAEAGRELVPRLGCLACHRLGQQGHEGPGPSLDRIGLSLSEGQIRRVLLEGRPPMPSYADLPPEQLDAVASYLSGLR